MRPYLFNEGKGMAILFLPSLMIKDEAKKGLAD